MAQDQQEQIREQMNQVNWLLLLSRSIRFATDHPYAATGIFGAMVGSAVTYKAMKFNSVLADRDKVVTPQVYEFSLTPDDLRKMQIDPLAERRWELPTMTVIVTSERRERPKELPDIKADIENE
jgi:hypothetical protein